MSQLNEIKDRLRRKHEKKFGNEKKICLTMIVKNESKIIERCLNSAKSIIDMIAITDTGSSDNTEETIIKWAKDNNLPCKIGHNPFKDFGYNRTDSVIFAKSAFPETDYFLLIDADMILENNGFNKKLLYENGYIFEQYNAHMTYWNMRLLSNKINWKCYGVTHEYWGAVKGEKGDIKPNSKINTLKIDDRGDGGAKADKLERDKRLLLSGLENPEEENNLKIRYKYYLANTLKSLGEFENAIDYYQKRIEDGGWEEELFQAMMGIGCAHKDMGYNYYNLHRFFEHGIDKLSITDQQIFERIKNFRHPNGKEATWEAKDVSLFREKADFCLEKAAEFYTNAYIFRKVRAESLYKLAVMYKDIKKFSLAYEIILIGKKIRFPDQDTLFVEHAVYDYLFDFEMTIVAYYYAQECENFEERKKIMQIGGDACVSLLDSEGIPDWIREQTMKNALHYN